MPRSRTLNLLILFGMLLVASVGVYRVFEANEPDRRIHTIGLVHLTMVNAESVAGFKAGMAELGYQDGVQVRYLYEGAAGSIDRLEPILGRQLKAGVDLIYTMSTPATLAAQRLTAATATPVVFGPVNDPVKSGIVQDQRHPGGNITGIRLSEGDTLRLEWLLRLAPKVRRILFPYNPNDASAQASLAETRRVSSLLGVELILQPVPDAQAMMEGIRRMPADIQAIFLPRDSSVEARIDDYVTAALARRIPLCAPSVDQVKAGALFSYGFGQWEIGHQAARLADQVLRGVSPGYLPVEPARNYLAINLKTARAIGLDIPDDTLRQAHLLIR